MVPGLRTAGVLIRRRSSESYLMHFPAFAGIIYFVKRTGSRNLGTHLGNQDGLVYSVTILIF